MWRGDKLKKEREKDRMKERQHYLRNMKHTDTSLLSEQGKNEEFTTKRSERHSLYSRTMQSTNRKSN